MAAQRSWTAALRRRGPWRCRNKLGRASTHYDEATAPTITARGGRRCPGHGECALRRGASDGGGDGNGQWALTLAPMRLRRGQVGRSKHDASTVARNGATVGWRRSCAAAMATAELLEFGGCAWGEEGGGNVILEAWLSAGGCWGLEGARLPALAALDRAPATRGQPRRPRGARTLLRSATEERAVQFVSRPSSA